MATPKKAKAPESAPPTPAGEAAPKINPFAKIKSRSDAKAGGLDHVKAPTPDVAQAVDDYKKLSAQIKSLEGELARSKGVLEQFGRLTFAQRQTRNHGGNFYIDGNEDTVSFQYQNASSALAGDDYQAFVSRRGEEAANALLEINVASVKFDPKTLEEPGVMDQVVTALQALPEELLERLFTPATYGVVDEVFVRARPFAKTPEEYAALMHDLKVRNYVKG